MHRAHRLPGRSSGPGRRTRQHHLQHGRLHGPRQVHQVRQAVRQAQPLREDQVRKHVLDNPVHLEPQTCD